MKKRVQQYIAVFLLIVLSVSIVPAESFHHHEEELIVCHDELEHIESKRFECELSDYTVPVFLNNNSNSRFHISSHQFYFQIEFTSRIDKADYSIPNYRGPPLLS